MALKNVDPGYRGGLRGFGTEERNPELNLSPVLSQAEDEAEAVGRSRPPGGLGVVGRADQGPLMISEPTAHIRGQLGAWPKRFTFSSKSLLLPAWTRYSL
ncbi:hypothetical protein D623_10015481 [Myotis brandtii]|uniref:Uncharacterized protein n=1 Tax=Myotis brandtii TaxID=109478 RepID=S7MNM7_MYOBR|nr:hypothetical protein D623_10015481 [Myotis brandtii]